MLKRASQTQKLYDTAPADPTGVMAFEAMTQHFAETGSSVAQYAHSYAHLATKNLGRFGRRLWRPNNGWGQNLILQLARYNAEKVALQKLEDYLKRLETEMTAVGIPEATRSLLAHDLVSWNRKKKAALKQWTKASVLLAHVAVFGSSNDAEPAFKASIDELIGGGYTCQDIVKLLSEHGYKETAKARAVQRKLDSVQQTKKNPKPGNNKKRNNDERYTKECRNGTKCTYYNCKFVHKVPRDIDVKQDENI
jgi:hypothetical protein